MTSKASDTSAAKWLIREESMKLTGRLMDAWNDVLNAADFLRRSDVPLTNKLSHLERLDTLAYDLSAVWNAITHEYFAAAPWGADDDDADRRRAEARKAVTP